jgi:hypothetical protein
LTSPPKHADARHHFVSPTTAAYYLNWAEYRHWRDRRMQSYAQYELFDPAKPAPSNNWGLFATGLLRWNGHPKPSFAAWVLPLYLPRTVVRARRPVEVWGCVRPAHYAIADTGQPQTVYIQFAPRGSRAFSDLTSVVITSAGDCYFDTRVAFPGSGSVRLLWRYPDGDPLLSNPVGGRRAIHSRTVQITVRQR